MDVVGLGDLVVGIGDQGEVASAETTLLTGGLGESGVAEDGVGRAAEENGVQLLELGFGITEGDDLGWANKGEVEGVKEEADVFAGVVAQGDLGDLAVDESLGGELGGGFAEKIG